MIDSRFSEQSFAEAGIDSPRAHDLADALAKEVQDEVKRSLSPCIRAIVDQLNRMGHRLQLLGEEPDAFTFRDERDEGGGSPVTKLRLAVDFVVSTGYAHLKTEEEIEREIFGDQAKKPGPGR